MKALIQKELRLTRRSLLIWLGFILILGGFTYFEYLSMKDSLAELSEMMNAFPKILMVTFGIGERLDTTLGWYGCIYYWVTILTYSYAVYLGVSCVGREKARGTSEYLFTKPVSRSQIVMAKTTASVINLLILSLFSGLIDYFSFVLLGHCVKISLSCFFAIHCVILLFRRGFFYLPLTIFQHF